MASTTAAKLVLTVILTERDAVIRDANAVRLRSVGLNGCIEWLGARRFENGWRNIFEFPQRRQPPAEYFAPRESNAIARCSIAFRTIAFSLSISLLSGIYSVRFFIDNLYE
jgi:hypothetical protein